MANSGVFIPDSGSFRLLDVEVMSFNDTAKHLGYHPDQIRSYSDYPNEDFYFIGFKVFTDEIVFVAAKQSAITAEQVRNWTSKYTTQYDSYEVEGILEDAISNGSFTHQFIKETFSLSDVDPNGSVVCPSIGYELAFLDGKLVGYETSDGFNTWAKSMKANNPKLFSNYVMAIRKRGGDEKMIRMEVNAQADAFANIPQGLLNPFIPKFQREDGTIDFVGLKAVHYS